ncbi:MAG TPA: hypothetical protein VHV80_01405 [Steroidobacteraceae bacterium]|jgi:hypothetical protein|nr:hypothetical protein [Steroidobacteraceae bacterium]
MRRIDRRNFGLFRLLAIATLFFLSQSPGRAQAGDAGRETWVRYSLEQKTVAVAGFVHCYRESASQADAFENVNTASAISTVDRLMGRRSMKLGGMILQALKNAPNARLDVHAEHSSGPYGFAKGLWWRGLDDRDRQAYVQGVFWCAENSSDTSINVPRHSAFEAVHRLNDWYVVADEGWKNPKSNARVDVPVIVAMKTLAIIAIGKRTTERPEPNAVHP